jgi:hypothetical protein
MNNNFKSADILFSKIKEDFSSFDNAHLIDDGRFYKDVKYILNLLGLNWYRQADEILTIANYKAVLPIDFHLADAIYKCDSCSMETLPDGVVLTKVTFDHYPTICDPDPHCYVCPEPIHEPCIFNRHEEILIQRDNMYTRYSNPVLLRPGTINTRNQCDTKCLNIYSDCPQTFTIQNGQIYTNFQDGTIFMSYYAFPLDEEGYPMIPDNEHVEKCIEYYIKLNIMETLWINSEVDVERKLKWFADQYKYHLGQAQFETKLPTFENMVKQIRSVRRRLDIYQLY